MNVRIGWLRIELDTVGLRPPDHTLLGRLRKGFPRAHIVLPLLEQQNGAPRPRLVFRNQGDLRCPQQARVLGAIDEPGEVAVAAIRPSGCFASNGVTNVSALMACLASSKTMS